MERHFELTDEYIYLNGKQLFRIKSTVVNPVWGGVGVLGGFVESFENIQGDDAWVFYDSKVMGSSVIKEFAQIKNSFISGNAIVGGQCAIIDCTIQDDAVVLGGNNTSSFYHIKNAVIRKNAKILSRKDYICISSLGKYGRTITFTKSNKMIACGCSDYTIEDFKYAVDEEYGKDSNSDYHLAIKFIQDIIKNEK